MAAEHLKSMKAAAMGQGGGLQSVSTAVGGAIAGSADNQSGQGKKSDDAGASISEMSKGAPGQPAPSSSVKTADQIANQQTGAADHLNLASK